MALTCDLQSSKRVRDEGACWLGHELKANSSLQELHLVSFFIILCFCFEKVPNVTRNLQDDNFVNDAGACKLAEGLKLNTSLQKLWLVRAFLSLMVHLG